MRISDWSSDVCSSDLLDAIGDIDELARLGVEHEDPDRLARAIGPGHQYDRLAVPHEAGAQIDIVHFAARRKVHDSALPVVKDRKSVVEGKSVLVLVDIGCRRVIKKKN